MANEVAGITLRADSREVRTAEKDLDRMSDAADRSEKAGVQMASSLRRAFAALGVGLIIRQIIRNTVEHEHEVSQLNAVLKSTGREVEQNSKNLQEFAKSLQQVSTFSDAAIISAQTRLLSYVGIVGDNFPRALQSVIDQSARLNISLEQSAEVIGRALESPAKAAAALSRQGFGASFTGEVQKTIKALVESGRAAEAQVIVLEVLEESYEGAAEAARNTFGGALSALKNTINGLLGGKGDGLEGATAAINDLNKSMNDPGFKRGADNITTALFRLTQLGAEATGELGNLGQQLGFMAASIAGNVTEADRLEQELFDVERALGGTIFSRPLKFIGKSREELQKLKAELEEALRVANFESLGFVPPKGNGKRDFGLSESFPEIVVTAERREKELAKIMGDIRKRIRQEGRAAAEDLTSALNALAAEMGGTVTQAAVQLSDTLAMLAEQERKVQLAAERGLLTTEAQKIAEQQLASARVLAVQVYNDAITAEERLEQARRDELAVSAVSDLQFELDILKLSNKEREVAIALRSAETDATSEQGKAIADLVRQAQAEREVQRAESFIADIEFELDLLGKSNKEREVAIALRHAEVDAASTQGQVIRQLITEIQKEQEAIEQMDALRSAAIDSFADAIGGFKSAGDALDDFFERMRRVAAQIIAEKLFEKILGSFGSSPSSGGFGKFLASVFGGGRAHGGPVVPGRLYEVAEDGPEILRSGSRQFLIPDRQGQITPVSNVTNNSRRTNINMTFTRPVSRETGVQLAQEIARTQNRAEARNR